MKAEDNSKLEKLAMASNLKASPLAALFFVAMAFLAPEASYGVTLYSGSSMGSTGVVYGWGVTDATWNPYNHTAYATASLRSPKGRTVIYSRNAASTVRADVSLAWDETDLGTYTTTTTHRAYCNYMGWFINGSVTSANIFVGVSQTTYILKASFPTGCEYEFYCPIGTTPTCGGSPLTGPPPCQTFKVVIYIYYRKSGITYCFGIGGGSPVPGGCT